MEKKAKKKLTGNKKNVNQDTTKTFMEMPIVNLKAVAVEWAVAPSL